MGPLTGLPIVHNPKEAAPRAGFFEADAFAAVRKHLPEDLQAAVSIAYTFDWRMQSGRLSPAKFMYSNKSSIAPFDWTEAMIARFPGQTP